MSAIAVVTGSSGFIGSRLVRQLVAEGYHVRRLVRSSSRPWHDASVETHVVDFEDVVSLRKHPALADAEHVFHLAGVTKALTADEFRRGNVVPTVNLLRALDGRAALRRVVVVSSQAAAGPARALDAPITESDPPRPIEGYGASKLEAEEEAREFAPRVPITIVRPCSVYGPGDVDFLPLFRMARRGVLVYPGTAGQYISLLHVDDVADGLVAAARAESTRGETVFFASQAPVRWPELGAAIVAAAGRRRALSVPVPAILVRAVVPAGEAWARATGRRSLLNRHKVALARPRYWICSAARAAELFGFQPRRDLRDGVESTYAWYAREGWLGMRSGAD